MKKVSKIGTEMNMGFWKFIKPFLTNEGTITGNDITLSDVKNMIRNEYEVTNTFNGHYYINIVEKSSDHKPINIGSSFDLRWEANCRKNYSDMAKSTKYNGN